MKVQNYTSTRHEGEGHPTFSVIIPLYNEEQTLKPLVERTIKTLEAGDIPTEIIIVDDGSTDKSVLIAGQLASEYADVKTLRHHRNLGKTAAIKTGFKHSTGEVIVLLDADLQYDPEDIQKLLMPIKQGFDVVNGWRAKRKDRKSRIFASKAYNWLVRRLFHIPVNDCNSGFKAMTYEALEAILPSVRRDLHRYLLPLADHKGYKIAEVPVAHNSRSFGRSKYASMRRLVGGLMDIIALKFTLTFAEKPMILFGLPGIVSFSSGILIGLYLTVLKYAFGQDVTLRIPYLLLAILLVITGILLFMFGFLAEMVAVLGERLPKEEKSEQA